VAGRVTQPRGFKGGTSRSIKIGKSRRISRAWIEEFAERLEINGA
jgi:hypothetical protein